MCWDDGEIRKQIFTLKRRSRFSEDVKASSQKPPQYLTTIITQLEKLLESTARDSSQWDKLARARTNNRPGEAGARRRKKQISSRAKKQRASERERSEGGEWSRPEARLVVVILPFHPRLSLSLGQNRAKVYRRRRRQRVPVLFGQWSRGISKTDSTPGYGVSRAWTERRLFSGITMGPAVAAAVAGSLPVTRFSPRARYGDGMRNRTERESLSSFFLLDGEQRGWNFPPRAFIY